MKSTDLLKKVHQLEIATRTLVNQIFSGEYHSVFKGRGMEFSEVREYQFGDDIRTIDWNVTARFDHPFVKVFEEERELTLMLLVDMSGSQEFGTKAKSKMEIAAEISAILAFSALKNNDKVGCILFRPGRKKRTSFGSSAKFLISLPKTRKRIFASRLNISIPPSNGRALFSLYPISLMKVMIHY
jgi:uncharacterized protein (DUF58 family)